MSQKGAESRHYNFWILVYPAPDLPGRWIAHCLDLDVMTHGYSLAHALEMGAEAVAMVVEDDLEHGFDPLSRRAPEEEWEKLKELQRNGDVTVGMLGDLEAHASQILALATQLQVLVMRQGVGTSETLPRSIPAVWSQSRAETVLCA